MVVDRDRFMFLAAVIAGCHEVPPSIEHVTLTAPTEVVTEAGPPEFCASNEQANQAVLAKPGGSCGEHADQEKAVLESLREVTKRDIFHTCHVGKGAWAVRLLSVALGTPAGESGNGCGWSASLALIFRAASEGVPIAQSPPVEWHHFPDDETQSMSARFFDYNGDGSDELIFASSSWANGGGGDDTFEVLRGDGATIAKYPVGFPYDGAIDADGDGRPDLLDGSYFAASCDEGLAPRDVTGVPLLVHSLADGTFSMSDEVARQWGVTRCPTMPTTAEEGLCPFTASCQRLWGRTPDAIKTWASTQPACSAPGTLCASADKVREVVDHPLPFESLSLHTPRPFAKK